MNKIIEIEIKKLGINGEGIGYYHKKAVFVVDVLPGEVVKVEILQNLDQMIYANLVEVIVASKDRLPIEYPHQQKTGAFALQHIPYNLQIKLKRDMLINAFNRYVETKIPYSIIRGMVPSDNIYAYRNKVSLPVRKIGGKNKFGLYEKNSNIFVPINDAKTQDVKINELLEKIENLLDKHRFDGYIQKEHSGYIKSVVIRRTTNNKEIQISFLLMKKYPDMHNFIKELISLSDEIKSVYAFYTDNYKEQVFFTSKYEILYGSKTITETLNNQTFDLYPESFFQLNTPQAHKLYQAMKKLGHLSKDSVAIDAYAGSAVVSHYISNDVKKVYAIEKESKSVQSAKESLEINNIHNVEVLQMDFKDALKKLKNETIDVMFFDPPRTGLGRDTVEEVIKFKPKKIVYTSCNPSTLAKDLNELTKLYKVIEVLPFDMFPFTPHVETITLLSLKTA